MNMTPDINQEKKPKFRPDPVTEQEWGRLLVWLQKLTGKKLTLDGVLFMIGVQELGQGIRTFSKEEKQDLMHIATCRVLSFSGYYELEGQDEQGWPHWRNLQPVPHLSLEEQEQFLKLHILTYFEKEIGLG